MAGDSRRRDDEPGDARVVAALADVAGLPLEPERVDVLAGLLQDAREEHSLLRDLPQELEPHSVFDPRWE